MKKLVHKFYLICVEKEKEVVSCLCEGDKCVGKNHDMIHW